MAAGSGSINSAGEITFTHSDFTANEHIVSLQVEDEIGAICQDTVLIFVGTPPTASIVSPLTNDVYSVGDTIIFQAAVADQEDQLNELDVVWTSSIDGELMSGAANSQGMSQFSSSTLTAGMHSISFAVTDSTGLMADDLITFRVNTPPTAPTVILSPDPISSTQTLTATASDSEDVMGIIFLFLSVV